MSDLVKRLREDSAMWDAVLGDGASLTREAADAIEELVSALQSVHRIVNLNAGSNPKIAVVLKAVRNLLAKYGAADVTADRSV